MALHMIVNLVLILTACVNAKWIVPGARWLDTDGNIFNAHAGGLCVDRESGRFYWFGEYKVEGQVEGGGISVYSSEDLATWESHGLALGSVSVLPVDFIEVCLMSGIQSLSKVILISRPITASSGRRSYTVRRRASTM